MNNQPLADYSTASPPSHEYRRFAAGVAMTIVTRLLMLIGVVGAGVLVARWLGPEGFGTLAVLTVAVGVAVQIGSAGLPSANTYFIARDRRSLAPVWTNAIAYAFIAGILLIVGVLVLARVKPDLFGTVPESLLLIAAFSIPFQLLTLLGLNVLLAMDRVGQLNLLDALTPALTLLNALVVLLLMRGNLRTLVTFNTAVAIVVSILVMVSVGRLLKSQSERRAARPEGDLFRRTIGYALKFSVPVIAAVLIFRIDLLILNHYRGVGEAGVYAAAAQVGNLLTMLPGVVASLLFPRVTALQDSTGEFTVRITRHASFTLFILCLLAAAASFLLFVLPVATVPRAPLRVVLGAFARIDVDPHRFTRQPFLEQRLQRVLLRDDEI